jgi:hypothetical protein
MRIARPTILDLLVVNMLASAANSITGCFETR